MASIALKRPERNWCRSRRPKKADEHAGLLRHGSCSGRPDGGDDGGRRGDARDRDHDPERLTEIEDAEEPGEEPTAIRGWVALIRKGSGKVVGLAKLVECGKALGTDAMIEGNRPVGTACLMAW
jgi:hypothetical protein